MTKTVAAIDGNSLMHRAYHAIQTPMSAPDGTPTNAVFGFLQMLCKFVEETHPDAVICAFDKGKPTERISQLPEYKAQRPHMDEELRVQFPIIEELLEAMAIPVVTAPGWEGDDVLGTIAAQDEKKGYKTLLVTGDKDACQLASELTSIVNTKKGISDVQILGPDEVMEKYGVTPDQFTDYLGLMGDTSDNIPGVPGIGPKSATTLLQKYVSIEGVYEHIGDLKGKQRQNLEENEDVAFLSRKIATIERDLDIEVDTEAMSFPAFDAEEVESAFGRYALVSPLARVLNLAGERPTTHELEIEWAIPKSEKDARKLVEGWVSEGTALAFSFVDDGESTLFDSSLKGAFFADGKSAFLEGDEVATLLAEALRSCEVVALDAKLALQLVWPPDTSLPTLIDERLLFSADLFDLSLAAYVLDSGAKSYSYEYLAETYLGSAPPQSDEVAQRLSMEAQLSSMLRDEMSKRLEEDEAYEVYSKIDLPLVPVLALMERTGVLLDFEAMRKLEESSLADLQDLAKQIYAESGEEFNIDSPRQLSEVLFEKMGIAPLKKNSRGYSTDASVMKELAKEHEIATLVLEYREISKIRSTYIDSLPKMKAPDGRIHTAFHETVTVTGRLSSSDPNLQNIPSRTEFGRKIRECFIPLHEGELFLSADYSQIELRLLAHMSGDPNLVRAFNSGADFHAMTAANVFGCELDEVTPSLRSRAKAVNFGIVYGQQAFGLASTLDIPVSEAKELIDMYFAAYPGVREYLDSLIGQATESGYAITLFGRKRHIPELRSTNRQTRGFGERTAMNHPMQGTAADIIKKAMCEVQSRMDSEGLDSRMLLQVHDELDFSVPEGELEQLSNMVSEVMENVVELAVPLPIDISWGPNWASAH